MTTVSFAQLQSLAPKMVDAYRQAFSAANVNPILDKYGISKSGLRVCHFFAQALAETGALQTLRENLNYSASRLMQVWPKRFPTLDLASEYAHDEQKLGDFVYGGRLGNTTPGDGFKFRGRGLLQITGRSAYSRFGNQLDIPLTSTPDLAFDPAHSLEIAAAEWAVSGHDGRYCNQLADADDIVGVTYAINGGQTGIEDRIAWLKRCKAIWFAGATPATQVASRAVGQGDATAPAAPPGAVSAKNATHAYFQSPRPAASATTMASPCRPYFKRPDRKLSARVGGVSPYWDVPALCKAYDWPTGMLGGGVIAIIELDGGYTNDDMKAFFKRIGQPIPAISDVVLDGPGNNPNQNPGEDDPDIEVAMDIQVAAAAYYAATQKPATVRVYWADNQAGAIARAVRRATADGCDVCSISWGSDEACWKDLGDGTTKYIDDMEEAAKEAAAKGLIVFAASGDNDSSDGGPNPANVDVPSSCPSVVGCGGTTKTANSEIVWNDKPHQTTGDGTGGGYSSVFLPPPWQVSAPQLGDHPPQRMVPDVAANANPNTGYNICVHGNYGPFGGTSAVAPLYAGLFAAFGAKLGSISATIWANADCFTDITQGDNGAFDAMKGPDPCTGLGAPIGSKLARLFHPVAPRAPAATPQDVAAVNQPEEGPMPEVAMSVAAPSAASTFNPADAVQYGLLIEAVYTMNANAAGSLTPPTQSDFPPGYKLTAWVQMKDFILSSTALKFYGVVVQSVAEPHRFILALRGTEGAVEWLDDATSVWKTPFKVPDSGSVSVGFNTIYETMVIVEAPSAPPAAGAHAVEPKSLRSGGGFSSQVAALLRKRGPTAAARAAGAAPGPTETLDVVGHSLGSALATLYVMENASDDKIPNPVLYTFASPMVGDATFVAAFNKLGVNSWRIVNQPDVVPMLPSGLLGYQHVAAERSYNSSGTTQPNVGCWHAMATYLSLIDPTRLPDPGCRLETADAGESAQSSVVVNARAAVPAVAPVAAAPTAIDASVNVTAYLPYLKSIGVKAVGRYYSIYQSKVLTKKEAQLISQAGLSIFVVYEDGAAPSDFDTDHGAFAAQHALQCAAIVGQPHGSAIYFAADFESDEGQVEALVVPYFQAIQTVFKDAGSPYKIGAYGDGLACAKLLDTQLCDYAWLSCSSSFPGTKAFYASKRWNIAQHPPTSLGGLSADPNEVNGDFGAFTVGASA
jgi:kumamolisin